MPNPNRQERILVVDDDPGLRALLTATLDHAGFAVDEAEDGRAALRRLHAAEPALVILDVGMPQLDGFQTLERIRDLSEVPVLMLTGRDAEIDAVRGLRGGADDYVTKPFRNAELVARVRALLRRAARQPREHDGYTDGVLLVDFDRPEVMVEEVPVALTPLEFRLLTAFVRNPDRVLTRDQLLELAWGSEWVTTDQVKNYVGYLRRKLGAAVDIETVRGFGYRFRPAAQRRGAEHRLGDRRAERTQLRVVDGGSG